MHRYGIGASTRLRRTLGAAFVLMMAATCLGLAQSLQEGEIRLLGKITTVDVGRSQFTMKAERFVVFKNRENAITPPKMKTVSITAQTVLSLKDSPEKKLSLKDLRAGMNVAATGKDSGQGKPLPARVVVVWENSDSGVRNVPATPGPGGGQTAKPERADGGIEGVLQAMKEGRWEAALTMLTPILTADWKDQKAWRLAAKLLAQAKRGGEDRLGTSFKAALLPATERAAAKRYQMLRVLAQSGFVELSLSDYESILQEDPMNAAAYAGRSAAYLEIYDLPKAEESASMAVKVNGSYLPGYVMKAKAQLERRNAEGAAETLRAALQKDHDNADAHGLMAQALLLSEETPQQAAVEAGIQRALELDPENAEGLLAKGMLHEQRREQQEAQKAWDRCLEVDPASRRARAVLNGLVIVREVRLSKSNGRVYGWTRDGSSVIFAPENDTGAARLLAADGSGQQKVVRVAEPTIFGGAALSPDSRYFAYTTAKWAPHVRKLYIQPVDNPGASVLVTQSRPDTAPPVCPSWSPDGKRLLFNDVNEYDATARLLDLDEACHPIGTAQPLPKLGTNRWVRWAPVPDKVVFCAPMAPTEGVFLFDLKSGTRSLLSPGEGGHVKQFPDLSFDMTRLVYGSSVANQQPISLYAGPADGSPDGRVLLAADVDIWEAFAFWAPEDNRVVYNRAGWGPYVALVGGKRRMVELHVQKPGIGGLMEGTQATVPLVVSVRNVTKEPQKVHLEVRLAGAQRALETAPADLEVQPKETAVHTFEVRPGARGMYRGVMSARGEGFEVEAPFSLQVTESWGDKTPVAVLPFAPVAPTAKESREELAAGYVAAVALDGVLSRLWQLNVLPNGSVLSRLGHWDNDLFRQNSYRSSGQILASTVGRAAKTTVRPTPRTTESGPESPANDAETLKRRCQTFKHSTYLITGTAGYAGGKLRIEACLVQVATATIKPDSTVAVGGELAQLPDLIAQLAAGLARKLGVALEPDQNALLKPGLSANPDALKQYGEACLLAAEGQADKAAAALQQSLTLDPSFGLAHQAMGLFHLSQRKVEEASAEFQIAKSLDRHDLRAREGLLRSYDFRSGRGSQGSENEVEPFLAEHPLNPSAHFALAFFSVGRGRNREAVEHYQLALRDPYLREELGSDIERLLSSLYLRDPSLDPKLAAEVEVEFQDKPLKEVLDALGRAANVIIFPLVPDQPVTLHLGKMTVGAAMNEVAKRVAGKYSRDDHRYFLVAK